MGLTWGLHKNSSSIKISNKISSTQITTTILGSGVVTILKLKEFKEENEHFFIEIEQEDGTQFWTQKSFSFEEILGMGLHQLP